MIFYIVKKKIESILFTLKIKSCATLSKKMFQDVQCFCLFLGYARSGHSLIGALLDAHPEIVMGIEFGVLEYVKAEYTKNQLFYALKDSSINFSRKKHNMITGYSYIVPNSWQGRYKKIRVIGDKSGGKSALQLYDQDFLLDRLSEKINIPVKILHVIRNPFDVITTMTIRNRKKDNDERQVGYMEVLPFIERFFKRASVIKKIKSSAKYEMLDIYHEGFIAEPIRQLERILTFLGLKSSEDYLSNCASILFKAPHKSRSKIDWDDRLIEFVEKEMSKYDFLERYTYAD